MKEKIIDLMEKALSAYSNEHILRYFHDVKTNGLTEHGFPRLTTNIGILISHGRRCDLLPLFVEMMDFCCEQIPKVKAANDFSVREVIGCLWEVERSCVVDKEKTAYWRHLLSGIEPTKCYTKFAKSPTDTVRNWALFTTVSEYFRYKAGLCDTLDFIELHACQQLLWLDENGMYCDNAKHESRQPIMYDLAPRGLFSLMLDQGYRGAYYEEIDEALKKAALLTLDMQSPNGEAAFGGRSNQFLHNEGWMIAIFEYEAKRYAREGNAALAARFRASAARALAVSEEWLNKEPIRHIKNRFPTETKYGCEGYAYFDKYMITAASNLWAAYLICDESIPFEPVPDHTPCVRKTSSCFQKLFVKAKGYGLEFELNGDPLYDANGLGRVHREGAPCTICLSSPCPVTPNFTVDIEKPFSMSLCAAIRNEEGWQFGAAEENKYEVVSSHADEDSATATLLCRFENQKTVKETYLVRESGVSVTVEGEGEIGYAIPVFCFDGEVAPRITVEERSITVHYGGWLCRYRVSGEILDTERIAANRNGHYHVFVATAQDTLDIKIEIVKSV